MFYSVLFCGCSVFWNINAVSSRIIRVLFRSKLSALYTTVSNLFCSFEVVVGSVCAQGTGTRRAGYTFWAFCYPGCTAIREKTKPCHGIMLWGNPRLPWYFVQAVTLRLPPRLRPPPAAPLAVAFTAS